MVDVADLAGKNGNLSAGRLADLRKQLGQAGVTTEPVDIWIDDQSLPVKKVEKARTATGAMTNTAHYSDYGVQVTAVAPPASDTRDFKDLVKSSRGDAASGSGGSS